MASLETSLVRAGIRNPKIVQKKGKHGVTKFEFHVTFSGISLQGDSDPSHFPWWNLKAQHDGTSEGIPFSTPARVELWYATVYQISPEILQLADIKSPCFHSNKIKCICALAAKNRVKQASYVPLAKRQKQAETSNFFKSRAETLNHWKNQAKGNNGKAASSSNNQGEKHPPPTFAKRMRLTKKHCIYKPRIKIEFDSSLGYPGEGPECTFASANVRGSIGDNKFYHSVWRMSDDKIDVVAFQELNVHRNNQAVLESHKRTANTLGYKLFIAPTATVAQIGGTAILVSLRLIAEG
eukprot:4186494-Pleurochrysis_carterae.AAC.1